MLTANLDDLKRLRADALAAGTGSGRWIKAATALMDAFPAIYDMAKAMNARHAELAKSLQALKPGSEVIQWRDATPIPEEGFVVLLELEGYEEAGCGSWDGAAWRHLNGTVARNVTGWAPMPIGRVRR